MRHRSLYANVIRDTLSFLKLEGESRYVEALMRRSHPTLDHLSADAFQREVRAAVLALRLMTPEEREALAADQGL